MPSAVLTPEAEQWTLGKEGGWYPGGLARDPNPTNRGVTQRVYDQFRVYHGVPKQSVEYIADAEVHTIYSPYWTLAGCQYCGDITAMTVFDMSLNGGDGTARRLLQRALKLPVDGVLGPATIAAIQASDDDDLADAFEWERVRRYITIVQQNAAEAPNFLGWIVRTTQFREAYLR
jgi:lysozyme family protein